MKAEEMLEEKGREDDSMSRAEDWGRLIADNSSVEPEWFECLLCWRILEEPVTTCLGKTVCKRCFLDAVEHGTHPELVVKDVDLVEGYQDVKLKEVIGLCCGAELDVLRRLRAGTGGTAEQLSVKSKVVVANALELEAERSLRENDPRRVLEALGACIFVRGTITLGVSKLYTALLQQHSSCTVDDEVVQAARDRANSLTIEEVERRLDDSEVLQCFCCLQFLFEPCTLPTGHTMCRECLPRVLELTDPASGLSIPPSCPYTKIRLDRYKAWTHEFPNNLRTNRALERVSQLYFEEELNARKDQSSQEMNEYMSEDGFVPIFVCGMTFPYVSCSLHIFEPRYRLMMRRSIESGFRKFGMCGFSEGEYNSVGTMLHIISHIVLPDGRSMMETRGLRRFRVRERSMRDGYNIAKIEYFDDIDASLGTAEPSGDPAALAEIQECARECHEILNNHWGQSLLTHMALMSFGEMPEELGPQSFWLAGLSSAGFRLPLDGYDLLKMDSLRQRWTTLRDILRQRVSNRQRLQVRLWR
eukprot:Plantae.Rhodophyta-Purpureofilum_apyrenoidigerum.ctg2376.p1 GENE.Plantae.Rhodophyta-Purpureofilum_apyrenoidigerum.ctg2376~~Plantae.Rhodophyta-Purpureofilum_apyrenoidigerum.ctg2376.p1  ORF type:complete len:530 (+),score=62.97 Plantae.Rhodophyta-Purpureofilum_apyrenoidigerum.ctg2376:195-1784(+)